MEFSEMKVIWDSQNQEPLYAMNEAALHSIVHRKNQEWSKCLARAFALEIGAGLFSAALMFAYAAILACGNQSWLIKPWRNGVEPSGWHYLGLLAAGAIWLYYAAYMYRARKRQQRRIDVFDSSLHGDLDLALSQTEFQMTMIRNIVWRGLVPVWVAGTLWMVVLFHLKGASAWIYVLVAAIAIASLLIVILRKQRLIRERYLPRQQELRSLRAKLVDRQH